MCAGALHLAGECICHSGPLKPHERSADEAMVRVRQASAVGLRMTCPTPNQGDGSRLSASSEPSDTDGFSAPQRPDRCPVPAPDQDREPKRPEALRYPACGVTRPRGFKRLTFGSVVDYVPGVCRDSQRLRASVPGWRRSELLTSGHLSGHPPQSRCPRTDAHVVGRRGKEAPSDPWRPCEVVRCSDPPVPGDHVVAV